jgi:serine/threonine protein phosphatase PrpC
MWRAPETRFDSACAISIGARDTQEDAVISDFPVGADTGFAVLADGMGGHSAGEIASRHVITQLYAALKFNSESYAENASALPGIMAQGLDTANAAIRDHVRQHPRLHGMGSTLICLALVEGRAHWVSVGDSPLYLLRGGVLSQLNQNHSKAHEFDLLVKSGAMDAEEALLHPDRSALTSAIFGGEIAYADCPEKAFELMAGDMLLLASDGLQFLSDAQIARILAKHRRRSAAEIASHLMAAIGALADDNQDNVSLSVIKVNHVRPNIARAQISKPTFKSSRPRHHDARLDHFIAPQSPHS